MLQFTPASGSMHDRLVPRSRYIRKHSGFTTPQEFGADTWGDVVPITFANVTGAVGQTAVGLRARVYWTVRFIGYDIVTWYAEATAALVPSPANI